MKNLLISAIAVLVLMCGCSTKYIDERGFVKVEDGEFVLDGKVLSFVGTNFWYGPILGSEGRGGNRERLDKELDMLKSIGVTNLRILIGSDGPEGVAYK
ncbi:MAG: beta-mannosidase, partial [Bacteroidales bacterium]|nr:beta-mannosidase [Bacteroidales bacterium]